MSVFLAILLGLAMGAVFGVALEKSRVFEPGVIVGQMQLRNFLMLKMFLTAVATSLVAVAALHGFGLVALHPKPTMYLADVSGGGLLGVGVTLAGACPGTVAAQIGAGYRDAWFTLLGGLAGAVAFTYAEPVLRPVLLTGPGAMTLDLLVGIPFWQLALGLAALLAVVLMILEYRRPWRGEAGAAADGLLPEPLPRPVPAGGQAARRTV